MQQRTPPPRRCIALGCRLLGALAFKRSLDRPDTGHAKAAPPQGQVPTDSTHLQRDLLPDLCVDGARTSPAALTCASDGCARHWG